MNEIDVGVKEFPQYGNKKWMSVTVKDGNEFVPSFRHWFKQIMALCECEEWKYADDDRVDDPLDMPRRFFSRCFEVYRLGLPEEEGYELLKEEFRLPR